MAKEINDVKGLENVKEHVVTNWFKRFKEVDNSLKDKLKLRPSVVEDVALLEMVK